MHRLDIHSLVSVCVVAAIILKDAFAFFKFLFLNFSSVQMVKKKVSSMAMLTVLPQSFI